jgi:Fur family transcriptional regulator, peroxide stress response regulator
MEKIKTIYLKDRKKRTSQRIKILGYLKSVKIHPTAEAVYLKVKKDLPAISLATVYRNLNALADNHEILRLDINKEFHFDADISCHQHMVCRNCGSIFDFFSKDISEPALKKICPNGFEPDCVRIIYYGVCKACRSD